MLVCSQIRPRSSGGEDPTSLLGSKDRVAGAYQIDASIQLLAINHDMDPVAFKYLADRPSGQGFGPDMPDTGAGRDTGETRIGQDRDLAPPGQMLQG